MILVGYKSFPYMYPVSWRSAKANQFDVLKFEGDKAGIVCAYCQPCYQKYVQLLSPNGSVNDQG